MDVLIEEKQLIDGREYYTGYTKNYIRILVPAEQLDKDHKVITADGTCRVNIVDQRHQACDRRVELHCLNVLGNLLNGLVEV